MQATRMLCLALAAVCATARWAAASDENELRLAQLLQGVGKAQAAATSGGSWSAPAPANGAVQGVPELSEPKEALPPPPPELLRALRWHQFQAAGVTPGAKAYEYCQNTFRNVPKESPQGREFEVGCLERGYIRDLASIPDTEVYYSDKGEFRLTGWGRVLALIALDDALEGLLAGGHPASPSRAHYESRCAGAGGKEKSLCMQHAYGLLLRTIAGGERYYERALLKPGETSLVLTALGEMFVRIHRMGANARILHVATIPGALDAPHTQQINAVRDACLNTYGNQQQRDRMREELETLLQACGGAEPCEASKVAEWARGHGCKGIR